MLYYSRGSAQDALTTEDLRAGLAAAFAKIGPRKRVLAVPPDFTRFHSQAGRLTCLIHEHFGKSLQSRFKPTFLDKFICQVGI